MTEEKPKEFGKRAPPVVLHKPRPTGSGGRPLASDKPKHVAEPLEKPPAGQKRSLAVLLIMIGALPIGAVVTIDWIDRKLNCEPDPANPEEQICKHSSGSTYRRSSGWHWSSGFGGSSGSHWSSGGSTHGVSFGGFGHSGGFSGGG